MATGQSSREMSTYVFLHLNTTCLPEQDQPCRITEICLMAVNQNSLNNNQNSQDNIPKMPRVLQKLVLCLKPGNDIQEVASQISLLKNEDLADCTSFSEITASLKSFLHNLTKPVCLIAHNGDNFDFAVLKAELAKAGKPSLIRHFYCADSWHALMEIDRKAMETRNIESISSRKRKPSFGETTSNLVLKKSKTAPTMQAKKQTSSMERSQSIPISLSTPTSYKLREYYEELFESKPDQSYSAEGFCTALIKVAKKKPGFFEWVNKHAKKFEEIMPADIN